MVPCPLQSEFGEPPDQRDGRAKMATSKTVEGYDNMLIFYNPKFGALAGTVLTLMLFAGCTSQDAAQRAQQPAQRAAASAQSAERAALRPQHGAAAPHAAATHTAQVAADTKAAADRAEAIATKTR